MESSSSVDSGTAQDTLDMAQHHLVCGTEDCKKNCQFYCNDCHRKLCEQCRDEHQKSPETKNHEVVPYRERRHKLPVEKCRSHPDENIDKFCKNCQIPVCSKCANKDHQKNALDNLEIIYSERFNFYLSKIYKIRQYFLPTSKGLQIVVKEDKEKIKSVVMEIKGSVNDEAETLKHIVDTMALERIEQVNKIEESLMKELESQDKTYKDYISYLDNIDKKLHSCLSSSEIQNNPIFNSFSWHFNIQPIPETTKPVRPVLTVGQYSKEDVANLLDRVTVSDTKPENREIKPMDTATKSLEYTVPGVDDPCHVSLYKSKLLWVSDSKGNLVHIDLQGNQLQKIQTSGRFEGYHTVSQGGSLFFTDKHNSVIKKIKKNSKTTKLIEKTGDWEPLSIHYSHINKDLLVGMVHRQRGAKVTRYNKKREEEQNITTDNKGQALYSFPHYITENINGDICTSEYLKQGVQVVDKNGQHKFFYTDKDLHPFGICTNAHGHILVCDIFSNTIHILDEHGQFLSVLLMSQQQLMCSGSVCVDDMDNLYVGQYKTNKVMVYKYQL